MRPPALASFLRGWPLSALATLFAVLVIALLLGPGAASGQSAPTISAVAVTSDAGDDNTYAEDDVIEVTLTFSEAVDVTGSPQLAIDMDPAEWGEKDVAYASGSGTASLTFTYTVAEPNISTQGIAVLANTLELNGGTIQSASSQADAALSHAGLDHDASHKVDWQQSSPDPTPEPTEEPTPTPEPTPPPVPWVSAVAVTSDAGSDDTYAKDDVIQITLTFSEAVDVTGSPQLKIDMDPAEWGEKDVAYASGSGTASLTFIHTVVEPNKSTQGIAVLENTLELNGGAIQSASSQTDADLSHAGLDHDASHKVDWQQSSPDPTPEPTEEPTPTPPPAPSVSSVAITSDAGDDNTYAKDDVIQIALTFSEAVDVTGSPQLAIDMDPAEWGEKQAGYQSGSGTASLTFTYTVAEPNISTQGIAVLANTLELNGGTIQSASSQADAALSHAGLDHDASHKVDWQQSSPDPTPEPTEEPTPTPEPTPPPVPWVSAVAVTSDAGSDDTYAKDDVVEVTVTVSEAVEVTGSPRLKIDMDPAEWGEKWAAYHSGSGTTSLTFIHTVVEPNKSTQGIAVLENTLELNGGTIQSASSQTDADLSHAGLDHDASHKVDWQQSSPDPTPEPTEEPTPTPPPAPSVSSVAITSDAGDDNTYAKDDVIQIALTFSEAVDVTGSPQLAIDMDPAEWGEKQAGYQSGSGSTSLTFTYTVAEPNISTQGIAVLANTLELNGGTIQSASSQTDADLSHAGLDHDASHKVDWQQSSPDPTPEPTEEPTPTPPPAPSVSSVAITSDAGDDNTYAKDDVIQIALTFSEAVDVTGSPQLAIDMDPAEWGEKQAGYQSGSGTASLTFAYTVAEPNVSTQGIAVLANTLELNGGTIQSASSQADAALSHAGLGHDPKHKVDWQGTPAEEPDPPAGGQVTVTVTATPAHPATGEAVELRADIQNAPDGSSPSYHWEIATSRGTWLSAGRNATFSFASASSGDTTFRCTVSFGSGPSATSDLLTVTWTQPAVNQAPVVNTEAEAYAGFTAPGPHAPRGVLVSKGFYQIFSDPDGDELTYSVSVSEYHRQLLDELSITFDAEVRKPGQDWPPIGTYERVWFLADAEDDWDAIRPPLPQDPFPVAVTLTATDPGGLSASVEGAFLVTWEPDFLRQAPSGLTHERVSSSELRLSWRGRQSVAYEVQSRHLEPTSGERTRWTQRQITEAGASSATVSGLSCDIEYDFRVRAVAAGVNSPFATLESVGTYFAGGSGADTLAGGSEGECYRGGPGADTLIGGDGDDIIRGGDGDDVIYGGNGPTPTPAGPVAQGATSQAKAEANVDWQVSPRGQIDLLTGRANAIPVAMPISMSTFMPFAASMQEQATPSLPTLVSNTGQGVKVLTVNYEYAQAFTTGGNTGGYTLTGASMRLLQRTAAAPTYTVSIYTNNSGDKPGSLVGTLTNPASLPTDTTAGLTTKQIRDRLGDARFTASGDGITLTANTSYWLVWDLPAASNANWSIGTTDSDAEDAGAEAGWSIWNHLVHRLPSDTTWNQLSDSLQITIYGNLRGGDGDDRLYGGRGNDRLYGGSGDDVLQGGSDQDQMDGGRGNDIIYGDNGDDTLDGGAGDDLLGGGEGDDKMRGGAGNDRLYGDVAHSGANGDDTLCGGDGHDFLDGGLGGDQINGDKCDAMFQPVTPATPVTPADYDDPALNYFNDISDWAYPGDTVSYYWSTAGVTVNLASPLTVGAGVNTGGFAQGDALTGIENVVGSRFNDHITGGAGPNLFRGGDGADTLDGGDAGHSYNAVDYRDSGCGVIITLRYSSRDDEIIRGEGRDNPQTCRGMASTARGDRLSDIFSIHGSNHGDIVTTTGYVSQGHRIFGHQGDDTLHGANGRHVLNGGPGNDTVSYSSLSNTLLNVNLASGRARLGGTAGGDGTSNTLVSIENAIGSPGGDTIVGSAADNILRGGNGDDTLISRGSPTVRIISTNPYRVIARSRNELYGEAGNDTLYAGPGYDRLDGGSGADTVSYANATGGVTVNLLTGQGGGGIYSESDTYHHIENVTGSDHGDAITGDARANVIDGGSGNDTLDGGAGRDTFVFRTNAGDDLIQAYQLTADRIQVCGGTAAEPLTRTGSDESGNHVITLTTADAEIFARITLTGITSGSPAFNGLNVTISAADSAACAPVAPGIHLGPDVTLTQDSDGNVTATWQAFIGTGYNVRYRKSGVSDWTTATSTLAAAATSHKIAGLEHYAVYEVQVGARVGTEVLWSRSHQVRAVDDPLAVWFYNDTPGWVSSAERTFFELTANKRRESIQFINYHCEINGGVINCPSGTAANLETPPTGTFTFVGRVTIWIDANGNELLEPDEIQESAATPHVTGDHTGATTPSVMLASGGDGEFVVSWEPQASTHTSSTPGDLTGWVIEVQSGSETTWTEKAVVGPAVREHKVTGLTNGSHKVRVRGRTSHQCDHDNDPLTPVQTCDERTGISYEWRVTTATTKTSLPTAPVDGKVATAGARKLKVEWEPPWWGHEVYGYTVRYREAGTTGAWAEQKVYPRGVHRDKGVNPRNVTLEGLTGGARYVVEVQALNVNGAGPWHTATPAGGMAVPAGPPGVALTHDFDGNVTATWDLLTGAGTVAGYNVRYRKSGVSDWTTATSTLAAAATSHKIAGLEHYAVYEVQVGARVGTEVLWSRSHQVRAVDDPLAVWFYNDTPGWVSSAERTFFELTANKRRESIQFINYHCEINGGVINCPSGTAANLETPPTGTFTFVGRVTIWIDANGNELLEPDEIQESAATPHVTGDHTGATTPSVMLASGGDGEFVVSWEPQASTHTSSTPGDLTGWVIEVQSGSETTWTEKAVVGPAVREHKVTGLTNGSHKVRVRGRTSHQCDHDNDPLTPVQTCDERTGISYEWRVTTATTKTSLPTAPVDGKVATAGARKLKVEWEPPWWGHEVYGYTVRYRETGTTGAWTEQKVYPRGVHRDKGNNPRNVTLEGLTGGARYFIEVQALNVNGGGPWHTATPAGGMAVPAGPPGVALTHDFDGNVTATWDRVVGAGYNLRYRKSGVSDWTTAASALGAAATSHKIAGLEHYAVYEVQVGALVGTQVLWSATETVRAVNDPLQVWFDERTPLYNSDVNRLFMKSRSNAATASVVCTLNGDQINCSPSLISFAVTPTGTYTVSATATASGKSATTPNITGDHTGALTPSVMRASGGNGEFVVSWVPYANPAGSAPGSITHWVIEVQSGSETTWTEKAVVGPAVREYKVTGLTNGSHKVRVRGRTSHQCDHDNDPNTPVQTCDERTGMSYEWPVTTATTKTSLPTAPVDGKVATAGSGKLKVEWEPPWWGHEVYGYTVRYRQAGTTGAWTEQKVYPRDVHRDQGNNPRNVTLEGLTAGTKYVVEVQALNVNGAGPWHTATPAGGMAVPGVVPLNAALTQDFDGNVTATWDLLTGATSYGVHYRKSGVSDWTTAASSLAATATSHKIAGLEHYAVYEVRVGALVGTQVLWSAIETVRAVNDPLAVWFIEDTPQYFPAVDPDDDDLIFMKVAANKVASAAVCYIGDGAANEVNCPPGTLVSLDVTADGTYTVRATATASGKSAATPNITGDHTGAITPSVMRASGGDGEFVVSWEPSAVTVKSHTPGGLTGWVIETKSETETTWTEKAVVGPTVREHKVTGLTNGSHKVRVRGRTSEQCDHDNDPNTPVQTCNERTGMSYEWPVTTATTKTSLPTAPVDGKVTGAGAGKLKVEWEPPWWGHEVYGYTVRYREAGTTGAWTEQKVYPREIHRNNGVNPRNVTLEGLTAGTKYVIEVQALNVNGASPWLTATPAGGTAAPSS